MTPYFSDATLTETCRHLDPHTYTLESLEEMFELWRFKSFGWEEAGYCWAYMPRWLRKHHFPLASEKREMNK